MNPFLAFIPAIGSVLVAGWAVHDNRAARRREEAIRHANAEREQKIARAAQTVEEKALALQALESAVDRLRQQWKDCQEREEELRERLDALERKRP